MSTINEQPIWENTVTEIDGTVGLLGGENGNFNLPIKQLANRTSYLKVKVDDLINAANVKIAALTNQPVNTSVVSNMIAPASVAEGDWLKVTVNLAHTLGKTNVPFSVSGSGIDNLDYDYSESKYTNGVTRNSDGTLNIPAGINNFQVQLWIRADSRTEGTDVINITVDGVKSSDCNISDISKGSTTPTLVSSTYTLVPLGKIINIDGSTNPSAIDNLVRGKAPGVHIDYYLETVDIYSNGNQVRRTMDYRDAIESFAFPTGNYNATFTTSIIAHGGPLGEVIFDYETWDGVINVRSGNGISTDHSYNMHDVTSRLSGITTIYANVSATLKSPNPNAISISPAQYGAVGDFGSDQPPLY